MFNINGIIDFFPGIIEGKSFNVDGDSYIKVSDGMASLTLQRNDKTKKIKTGQRFIFMEQPYKVTGRDYTKIGLIIFTCQLDIVQSEDDLEAEIAENDVNVDVDINEEVDTNIYIDEDSTEESKKVSWI